MKEGKQLNLSTKDKGAVSYYSNFIIRVKKQIHFIRAKCPLEQNTFLGIASISDVFECSRALAVAGGARQA